MNRMFALVTIVLGLFSMVGGCRSDDGHPDHDHANMNASPVAQSAPR